VINEYGDELATDDNAQDGGENYANASDAGQNPGDDDTDGGDLAVDDDGSSWV